MYKWFWWICLMRTSKRLIYTEVRSQQMAFTRSPSLSNNPKTLYNYLILHTLNKYAHVVWLINTVCQCFDPIIRWNESETKANLETMSASLTRTQRDQVRWKRQCLSLIGHLFYSSVKSCTSFIVCQQGPTGRVFQCRAGSGIGKNDGYRCVGLREFLSLKTAWRIIAFNTWVPSSIILITTKGCLPTPENVKNFAREIHFDQNSQILPWIFH